MKKGSPASTDLRIMDSRGGMAGSSGDRDGEGDGERGEGEG